MVTLFLAIPLGLVARFVPLGAARHLYNFGIGIFYAQMCYGPGWLHLFFSSWVAYLILLLLPRTKSHLLVFGWMMAYMGVMHVYRMWSDWLGWQMDFSGPQMMATIKACLPRPTSLCLLIDSCRSLQWLSTTTMAAPPKDLPMRKGEWPK